MAPILTTTFGIEIEFVVAYKQANYANKLFLENRRLWEANPGCLHNNKFRAHIISHMVDLLREAGFSVNDLYSKSDFSNWTVDTDGSIDAWPESPWDPEYDGMHFYGMELKTPVLLWSEAQSALCQVQDVLDVVRRNFKIFTNTSCGLHDHVGNQDLGFPLRTLKNLAKLVTVFERQFESIHPSHRVYNLHCRSPGANFAGMTLRERLGTIGHAKHKEDLVSCMSSCPSTDGWGFAYKFSNLITSRQIKTIEFRQHEATLDVREMGAWAILVCGLVEKCDEMSEEEVSGLIFRYIDDKEHTLVELLCDLGLEDLAAYYRRRGLYSHGKLGRDVPDNLTDEDEELEVEPYGR